PEKKSHEKNPKRAARQHPHQPAFSSGAHNSDGVGTGPEGFSHRDTEPQRVKINKVFILCGSVPMWQIWIFPLFIALLFQESRWRRSYWPRAGATHVRAGCGGLLRSSEVATDMNESCER